MTHYLRSFLAEERNDEDSCGDHDDWLLRLVHTGATKRFEAQETCQLRSLVSFAAVYPLKHKLP